ncbi:MAG: OmpH family outer membrane protein [Alphaproteobacteria bacterium]|nr:OmpH family outer membrane protein [Alphaproteobacteria bacterium]
MKRLSTQHLTALLALAGVGIGFGFGLQAFGATQAAQPRAVISNPTATVAAPAASTAQNGPPAPRIIVIDRNFILQRSTAGQDILNQTQNLSKSAETEFKNQEGQLQAEANKLQQDLAIAAPDVREQKEKEFTGRQQAFQNKVAQRQAEIQAGFNKAAHEIEIALEPILKTIMVERGANMVFDRSAIILSTVDVDVTPVAVQRLNKALPHVKVELTAAPAPAAAAPGPAIAAKAPATPPVLPAIAPKK